MKGVFILSHGALRKEISFLGENIQTIRKHRGMKQQELADKIGINMQSLFQD